jgi:FKBP-type peptidyl-prolyl cis-trans isomerase
LTAKGITDYFKDPSGIRFVYDVVGTGGFPARTDQSVKVKYKGYYLDGTVFDDGATVAAGPLGSFIVGWQYALSIFPPGTKGTLYVPSPLGYGPAVHGSIPANSILVFDIDYQEVTYTNAEIARFTSDTTAIDVWLADRNINAIKDTTGVRYVITNQGEGVPATYYTQVKFTATGKQMSNQTQFFNGTSQPTTDFPSRVVDFIHGLQVPLMRVGVGGKFTAYIPSGLAFGPYDNSSTGLPANSNVIYEVEILDIIR